MDSLRRRGYAYAIGAFEFADNIRLNILDVLKPYETPPDISRNAKGLQGKLCIITGGNAGIGKAFAEAAFRHGAHIILACRSRSRGAAAAKAIEQSIATGEGNVEVRELDLASLASVQRFAHAINAERRHVDILVCNAGIMAPSQRSETSDGFENQFQVNYLGHWLLAYELFRGQDQGSEMQQRSRAGMRSAPEGKKEQLDAQGNFAGARRLIFLSSMTHRAGHLDFSNLQLERGYTGFQGYANSKLATLLAAKEWNRRFRACDSTRQDISVAVHPGLVDTELARGWLTGADVSGIQLQPVVAPLARMLAPWLLISTKRAVDQLMLAATGPPLQVAGQYIAHGKPRRPSSEAEDAFLAKKLWSITCQLTSLQEGHGH
ncbi:hypothetical protein CVIRNUC_002235 [Coccomyxa viridis]|uniref:Uncharacterized protein n=1 Tax=Coccomyxa viridis TaxID=1274662 RepID=A0AAV1HVW0_9CHLO|nr:hypothetical protein CVIRNUC_002235 [Coccomyxa viridis]